LEIAERDMDVGGKMRPRKESGRVKGGARALAWSLFGACHF